MSPPLWWWTTCGRAFPGVIGIVGVSQAVGIGTGRSRSRAPLRSRLASAALPSLLCIHCIRIMISIRVGLRGITYLTFSLRFFPSGFNGTESWGARRIEARVRALRSRLWSSGHLEASVDVPQPPFSTDVRPSERGVEREESALDPAREGATGNLRFTCHSLLHLNPCSTKWI